MRTKSNCSVSYLKETRPQLFREKNVGIHKNLSAQNIGNLCK